MTKLQREVLVMLANGERRSAYQLGYSLNTLNSLALKGFLKADRSGLGCLFSPRTGIGWYITDEGREAIGMTV